jgi:hypothetical protein
MPMRPSRAESPGAVLAVADTLATETGPAVVRKAVRPRALDDLPENAGKILFVIWTVDARHVLIRGPDRLALDVVCEPVRVCLEEVFRRSV